MTAMELTATVRKASLRKVNAVSVKKATTLMARYVKVSDVQATFPCTEEIHKTLIVHYRAS